MKKKILFTLIIILIMIFTTGCTVDYKLKYENDTFTEYLNVNGEKEDNAHPNYEYIKKNGLFADVDGKEKFILEDSSSRYNVNLTHELKKTKLDRLKSVTECFTLNTYKETESSYYISLYGNFTCQELKDSTFTFETNEKVTIHNAHKVEENKYIWNLNEKKLGSEGIKFQVMKSNVENLRIGSDTMLSTSAKILIGIVIIGIGIGLFFIARKIIER